MDSINLLEQLTKLKGFPGGMWLRTCLPMQETKDLWTLWERERVGRFGRMALKHPRLGSGVRRRWDKQASFGKKRQPICLCFEASIWKEWVSFS